MAEAQPVPVSNLALLPGIVDQPDQTLAQVVATPRWRWLVPALLYLVSLIFLMVASAPYVQEQARQQQAEVMSSLQSQMGEMTESERQQFEEQIARFTSPAVLSTLAFGTGVIGLLIAWVLGSGFVHVGLVVGGRDLRFGQTFAGYTWTWLPLCLRNVVHAGWILYSGKLITNPGLSYFFSTGDAVADASDPLWVSAGYLDLFFLWHLLLVYFLVRAVRKRGGLGLTLAYALASLVVYGGFKLLLGSVNPVL